VGDNLGVGGIFAERGISISENFIRSVLNDQNGEVTPKFVEPL
jgi:hypothetical protein